MEKAIMCVSNSQMCRREQAYGWFQTVGNPKTYYGRLNQLDCSISNKFKMKPPYKVTICPFFLWFPLYVQNGLNYSSNNVKSLTRRVPRTLLIYISFLRWGNQCFCFNVKHVISTQYLNIEGGKLEKVKKQYWGIING